MEKRVVQPELLDELDSNDPAAIRSRRDLRVINRIMRGDNWILKQLNELHNIERVIEIGAGEGILSRKILKAKPSMKITAVDLAPRPKGLVEEIEWRQESAIDFDYACDASTAIVANLFIHQFENDVLRSWGENWRGVGALLLAEPYRSIASIRMGRTMYPFVNYVTRHDMKKSIEAGFHPGEMQSLLGDYWAWEEDWNFVGSLRCKGVRK
ncbi:MAG: hypothetical protein AB8F34_15055 [Akkermansiaceae bacterium]